MGRKPKYVKSVDQLKSKSGEKETSVNRSRSEISDSNDQRYGFVTVNDKVESIKD